MENNRHRTVGTTTHTLREKARIKQTDGKRKGEKNKTNKIKKWGVQGRAASSFIRRNFVIDVVSYAWRAQTHSRGRQLYTNYFSPLSPFFLFLPFCSLPFHFKGPLLFCILYKAPMHIHIHSHNLILNFIPENHNEQMPDLE